MPKLTDAVARIYERLYQPNQDILPFSRAVDAARAAYEELRTRMLLSDVEWHIKDVEFRVPGKTQLRTPVPASDYGFAVQIEYTQGALGIGSIPLVAVQNLHHYRRQGIQAASFVGKNQNSEPEIEFALYTPYLLRLRYEPDVELYPETDTQLSIRAAFTDYLSNLACQRLLPALQLPNVNMDLLAQMLMKEEAKWQKLFDIAVHKQPGKGQAKARPASVVSATRRNRNYAGRI